MNDLGWCKYIPHTLEKHVKSFWFDCLPDERFRFEFDECLVCGNRFNLIDETEKAINALSDLSKTGVSNGN